eukprot:s2240_g5.t1
MAKTREMKGLAVLLALGLAACTFVGPQAPSGPPRGELSQMRAAGEYTGFVPDMQPLGLLRRRQLMNFVLVTTAGIPVLVALGCYLWYFVPPVAGGGGGAQLAGDVDGNPVTLEAWVKGHKDNDRRDAGGMPGDPPGRMEQSRSVHRKVSMAKSTRERGLALLVTLAVCGLSYTFVAPQVSNTSRDLNTSLRAAGEYTGFVPDMQRRQLMNFVLVTTAGIPVLVALGCYLWYTWNPTMTGFLGGSQAKSAAFLLRFLARASTAMANSRAMRGLVLIVGLLAALAATSAFVGPQAPSVSRGEVSTMRAAGEYTGFVPDMQRLGCSRG